MQRIVPVDHTQDFLKALINVKKISTDWVFKQYKNNISIRSSSLGKEVTLDIKAPLHGFKYNSALVGLKAFDSFFKVYSIIQNPKILIRETYNELTGDVTKINSIIIEGDDTTAEIPAHDPTKLNSSDKNELPSYEADDSFAFAVDRSTLAQIKRLTDELIEASAESGTRLDIYKAEGDEFATFRFKGLAGRSFDKVFKVEGCTKEVNINIDPLVFTWLTADDYVIRVRDGKSRFLMAQTVILDSENKEVCTYSFICGKLTSPAANPLEFKPKN